MHVGTTCPETYTFVKLNINNLGCLGGYRVGSDHAAEKNEGSSGDGEQLSKV